MCHSRLTSVSGAPILFIFRKPLMPKVDGKRHETAFQKRGTADPGHDTPEMKSKGKEEKTIIMMTVSRWRIMPDTVMAKKMQAKRNGTANKAMSAGFPIWFRRKRCGTTPRIYTETTM